MNVGNSGLIGINFYSTDPTGADTSVFNPQQYSLTIALDGSGLFYKTSTDNATFQKFGITASGTFASPTFTGTITQTGIVVASGTQSLSGAGAVDLITPVTKLTTTGANALTLANGTNGQIKTIVMLVDGGDGTLTPTTKTGYSTITFNDVGDVVVLQYFTTLGWVILSNTGATVA